MDEGREEPRSGREHGGTPAGGREARHVLAAALVAAVLVLGHVPGALEAQDEESPLVGDRPDFTESAVAVRPGRAQLEAGYTFTRDGETRLHDVGEALLRVGVIPRAELRVGVNSFSVDDPEGRPSESGFRDTSLGAKLALPAPSGRAAPKAALLVNATLPTGGEEFGTDGVQPGAVLALEWEPVDRVGVGTNVGYTRAKESGDRFDEVTASGALSYGVSDATAVFAEYFGIYGDGDDENFLNGGLTYLLGPDLQLDGRLGMGLDGPDPDYFAGVGVILRR